MKLNVDKFEIFTDKKIKRPLKVVLLSDVHAGNLPLLSGKRQFRATIRDLKKISGIDFFALCGDYMNNAKSWEDSRAKNNFLEFLSELTKIAPVFMVRGNHDIFLGSKKSDRSYLETLEKMENVTLVDNEQKEFFGIRVTGFAPKHEAYDLGKHGEVAQKIVAEEFSLAKFKFEEKEFNLILTHSPYNFINKTMMREFPEVFSKGDIVLSGHLHNGFFVTRNFERITKYFNGIKNPSGIKKFFAKHADFGVWFGIKTGFLISHCRGAKLIGGGEIGYPILPSSEKFVKIDLTKNKGKMAQIVGKAVVKFSFIPIFQGRPSATELKITPKDRFSGQARG